MKLQYNLSYFDGAHCCIACMRCWESKATSWGMPRTGCTRLLVTGVQIWQYGNRVQYPELDKALLHAAETNKPGWHQSICPGLSENPYAPAYQRIHMPRTIRGPLWLLRAESGGRKRGYQQVDLAQQNAEDEGYMQMALEEARKAFVAGEVPVGAVLVHEGVIVARAFNRVEAEGDPTAHAEMLCIQRAARALGGWRLLDSTLYVTLEPCPMCAGALLQARVGQVVWGAKNIMLGADGSWISLFPRKSDESGCEGCPDISNAGGPVHPFHPDVIVRRGVLAASCSQMMKSFFQMRRKSGQKQIRHSKIPFHPLIRLFLAGAGQAVKALHRKLSGRV